MVGYPEDGPRLSTLDLGHATSPSKALNGSRHGAIRSILAFLCLLVPAGCQSPAPPALDPAQPEECPYSQTQGQVTVAAWPWTNKGQVKKQFETDMLGKRILPVQVVIANRGEETVRFSSTQAELAYDDDCVEGVLSEGAMWRRTQKNSGTAPFLIYVGTLGFGAPISMAMGPGLEEDNLRMRQVRRETNLSTVTLDAQETMCGFLFFDLPEGIKLRRGEPLESTLAIRRLPTSSGQNLAFRIPVSIERQ